MTCGLKMKNQHDNKQSTSRKEFVDLSYMPPLEGDEEEVKERKILKIFDPKQIIS